MESSIPKSRHAVIVTFSEFYHLIYANLFFVLCFSTLLEISSFCSGWNFHILETKLNGLI